MSTGDLCYVKGGSGLAYSKITANNGALIYKSGSSSVYVILTPRAQDLNGYVRISYEDGTSRRVLLSGYTQEVTKLNNQHVTLTKTQDSPYTLRLDGLTTNDSVDISYTVSFSLGSDHDAGIINTSFYMFGHAYHSNGNNVFAHSSYQSINVSSSQSYVTSTWTYRITINDALEDWFTIEDL